MVFGDRKTPMKRTAMKRGTSELKRTELKRGDTPMAKVGRKGKADKSTLTSSRVAVEDRSGGYCEFRILGQCQGEAVHIHHRQTGHSNHELEALAHLCDACHRYTHLHPEMAYQNGWLVKHPTNPATIPWGVQ